MRKVKSAPKPLGPSLDPYVSSMLGASGLNEQQAKTCVYYALATYHIDKFDKFPALVFQGGAGTGKSSAMMQVGEMSLRSKEVLGRTYPTVRNGLNATTTALIDEADFVPGLESLLTYRYGRENGAMTINQATGSGAYTSQQQNIFGATILVKRKPFRDQAMRSRAIIIRTKARQGKYKHTQIGDLSAIAATISPQPIDTNDRVMDTWQPLLSVAKAIGDTEWLKYARHEIDSERRQLQLSQGIEPTEALLHALRIFHEEGQERVKLSDLKETLRNEFDTPLTIPQVMELAHGQAIKVVTPKGYPQVVIDPEQLDRLMSELEGQAETGE